MSVSVDGPKRGRRKEVNGELLLVPYIDLLTCMVAFLLITAVWTQLARLEVQQRGQGESGTAIDDRLRMDVLVHGDGFVLVVGENQQPLPWVRGAYDYQALASELKKLKATHQDKTDLRILSEDGIKFDVLVKTMDAVMSAGFPDLSLLDAGGAT